MPTFSSREQPFFMAWVGSGLSDFLFSSFLALCRREHVGHPPLERAFKQGTRRVSVQNRTRRDAMYDSDNVVYSGAWQIGRIYERRGFPENVRWFWSLHGVVLTRPPDIHTDGAAPTLEAAKAEFGANWKRWLEWAGLEEVP